VTLEKKTEFFDSDNRAIFYSRKTINNYYFLKIAKLMKSLDQAKTYLK